MEFRTYAANETTALAKRLLAAQTEASAHHLRTLREAFDATLRALEESSPPVGDDVQEFVKKVTNATAAAVKTASQRIRDEAQSALDAARRELDSEREQSANLAISLERSAAELAAIRTEHRDECERTEALQRELAGLLETHKQLEIAHEEARASSASDAESKAALETELREARALLDASFEDTARLGDLLKEEAAASSALRDELEAVKRHAEAANAMAEAAAAHEAEARASFENELQEARAALDAALAEDARLGEQLETAAAEKGKLLAALSAAQSELQTANEQRDAIASQLKASSARAQSLEKRVREQSAGGDQDAAGARAENGVLRREVERLESLFDASLRALNELGSAATVTELLAALVKQLSAGFSRVALFRVKSNRLEGEFQLGFDQTTDVTKLVMPLNVDSPLTRVVNSGEAEALGSGALADGRGVPFGGTSGPAIALPIVLQDQTLAVVYADHEGEALAAGAAMPESTARFARLLVRQSVVLLMRMTHELKTLTELRDYAALLLQEAERMHTADADAGTNDDQLRGRLKDSIECARTLYAQRASLEGPGAAALLDEQISAALEAKAGTRFARDLAALVGRSGEAARRTAS
jgi:hypothetical protein